MDGTTPPGVSAAALDRALKAFAAALGDDAVLGPGSDLSPYQDPYGFVGDEGFVCSAAVLPRSVEEVQAAVRIAGEHGIPLWTFSTGRNLGYGGGAPRVSGSIALDLHRMNRIIEVNEEQAYCVVEPGVQFFDLYEYVKERRLKLWISAPALGWGSVLANALERGIGYTPYGDHAAQICGLEVVLANGEVVRTGMGALPGSTSWQLFKGGYGPSLDGVFLQSNLGVVTKMGLWMMPQPDGIMPCEVRFQNEADLEAAIDAVGPLRRRDVIQNHAVLANVTRQAASIAPRSRWYDGEGAMPEEVLTKIQRELGGGYWNLRFALYGDEDMLDARFKQVRRAFDAIPGAEVLGEKQLAKGPDGLWPSEVEGPTSILAGVPALFALQPLKFRGEDCGHLGFSPIVAPNGKEATRVYKRVKARARENGMDYFGGFTCAARHLHHIFLIIYDRHDASQTAGARSVCKQLVEEFGPEGIGEYRAHVAFMDLVGEQYSWGDHALRRLNERLKDALDPKGILSPGKQGVWPQGMGRRT